MGAKLVGLVLDRWARIEHNCFRVLVRMALTALDSDTDEQEAGIYYGGWELLADTLNQRGSTVTLKTEIRRIIARLVELGAIERVVRARRGVRAEYRLLLDRTPPE